MAKGLQTPALKVKVKGLRPEAQGQGPEVKGLGSKALAYEIAAWGPNIYQPEAYTVQ